MEHLEIRPSKDLRTNYRSLSKICNDEQRPVAVTVNGRADTVLLSHAQYTQMQAELELYRHLAQSEDDIKMGRVSDAEEVFERIEKNLRAVAKV